MQYTHCSFSIPVGQLSQEGSLFHLDFSVERSFNTSNILSKFSCHGHRVVFILRKDEVRGSKRVKP